MSKYRGKRNKFIKLRLGLENLRKYLGNGEEWRKRRNWEKRWVVERWYSVFKRKFSEDVFSKKIGNIYKEVAIKLTLMNLFTYAIKGDIQRVQDSS